MAKKQQYKGVRHIASVLRKYSSKQFPTYKSAIGKAKEISAELKKSNQKTTVGSIRAFVTQKRVAKVTLDERLKEPSPYWLLKTYPDIIPNESQKVLFVSKLFPTHAMPLKGGYPYESMYETYFASFVRFCNKKSLENKNKTGVETTSSNVEWHVKCLEPDKKNVSRIISCNVHGEEVDFLFNRDEEYPKTPKEQKQKKGETLKEEPSKTETKQPANDKEVEKEAPVTKDLSLDIEKEKTKQKELETKQKEIDVKASLLREKRKDAMDLFKSGLITKEEFKEMYE